VFSWLLQLSLSFDFTRLLITNLQNIIPQPPVIFQSIVPPLVILDRLPSSRMDRYPAEQDELVAQFCAMTGVQASDVCISKPGLKALYSY